MPRTTHGHVAEIELGVSANGIDGEIDLLVKYDFTPGSRAYTPRGEYAPIDPPEPPEINVTDLCVRDWLHGGKVWRTADKHEWDVVQRVRVALSQLVGPDNQGVVQQTS